MRSLVVVAVGALMLAGCSHPVKLMARDSALTGEGSATGMGGSGSITIALGGKTYSGTWAMGTSGMVMGFGTTTVTSGPYTAFGNSTMVGGTGNATASALLSSPDGSSLRCQFQISQWTNTGTGVCQDGSGRLYDAMVTK